METGERLADGIRREVREETGLEIDELSVFEIFERIIADAEGKTEYHYVLIDYVCRPQRRAGAGDGCEPRGLGVATRFAEVSADGRYLRASSRELLQNFSADLLEFESLRAITGPVRAQHSGRSGTGETGTARGSGGIGRHAGGRGRSAGLSGGVAPAASRHTGRRGPHPFRLYPGRLGDCFRC